MTCETDDLKNLVKQFPDFGNKIEINPSEDNREVQYKIIEIHEVLLQIRNQIVYFIDLYGQLSHLISGMNVKKFCEDDGRPTPKDVMERGTGEEGGGAH